MKVLALSGGVGGAKLALGLARVLPPGALTVVANTADDFEHLGFYIAPDLDTVMYTLAGRANRIKGFSIGVAVFGRDAETFDPQTDPVVRLEAGRLRRDLERYYLTAGQDDPIVVTVPKGGYVPAFHVRTPAPRAM